MPTIDYTCPQCSKRICTLDARENELFEPRAFPHSNTLQKTLQVLKDAAIAGISFVRVELSCFNCTHCHFLYEGLDVNVVEFPMFGERYVFNKEHYCTLPVPTITLDEIKAKPKDQRTPEDWERIAGEM